MKLLNPLPGRYHWGVMRTPFFTLALVLALGGCFGNMQEAVEPTGELSVEADESEQEAVFAPFELIVSLPISGDGYVKLARSPVGDQILGFAQSDDSFRVDFIDSASATVVGSVEKPKSNGETFGSSLFSPDGSLLALYSKYGWEIFESSTLESLGTYGLDQQHGRDGAFSSDNLFFYFSPKWRSKPLVRVVDLDAGLEIEPLIAGPFVSSLYVAGEVLVVSNNDDSKFTDDSVTFVDRANGSVVKQILIGDWPRSFALSKDSGTLFIANIWGDEIVSLDMNSYEVSGSVESTGYPSGLNLSPNGEHLLVSHTQSSKLRILHSETLDELQSFDFGSDKFGANAVVFSADGTRIFVTQFFSSELHVFQATN